MSKLRDIVARSSLTRYTVTGILAFLAELIAITSFITLGLSPLVAVAIAFWIGFLVAFVLQKYYAFKNKDRRTQHLAWQAVSYTLLVLINYVFTLIFVSLTEPVVGIVIARAAALGITTTWNYILYRWVIFNQTIPSKIKHIFQIQLSLRNLTLNALLVLPIIAYTSPLLLSGSNTILYGDYDMQVQMTEAARISMLEFKEFPFWNPWVSGGVPLLADPQFGLITPQTFYSFFTSSPMAWKLTIVTYFIVGFFAMKTLLSHVTERSLFNDIRSSLLAYVWIFGSFFTLRSTGHFTFLLLMLAPLAIYFYFNLSNGRRYVIYLLLLVAYLFGAALHYSSILIVLLLILLGIFDIVISLTSHVKAKNVMHILDSYAAKRIFRLVVAIAGGMVLASPRIYLSLEYLQDNSVERTSIREPFLGFLYGLETLIKPYGTYDAPNQAVFPPFEASSYIGGITFSIFCVAITLFIYLVLARKIRLQMARYAVIFLSVACVAFIIGVGGKPFELLRELPVMSSMRVSTRYFIISALALIAALATLLHLIDKSNVMKRRVFTVSSTILLGIAAVQVAVIDYRSLMHPTWQPNDTIIQLSWDSNHASPPRSEALWRHEEPHYYALTEATMNNHAQIIADNALVDTRVLPTARCDEDEVRFRCSFVLSNNAIVTSWSPNSFTLERTATGPIRLNMNQAAHWTVNGKYVNANQKTVEASSVFTIDDSETTLYTVIYRPLPRLLK